LTGPFPRATAFHEAGHAVVAYCLGLEVRHICINSDDESGRTDTLPHNELTMLDQATFILAAVEAQKIWDAGSKHMAAARDYGDFINLTIGLADEEREEVRLRAIEHAKNFLLTHKAQVEAVAHRLMERGQIDGSEFMRLMQGGG